MQNGPDVAPNLLHFSLFQFPEIPRNREKFPGNGFHGISREWLLRNCPGISRSGKIQETSLLLMIAFATRGQRMKVVLDGKFIAKKNENLKILSKIDVIYLKRKLRTCRIQIQVEIV